MAEPSPLQALRVPGRVAVLLEGQTWDAGAAWPHGGTGLGLIQDVRLRRRERRFALRAEEFGGEQVDALLHGEEWTLTFSLRGWDADAIATTFPSTVSTPGLREVRHPGTAVATWRSASAVPLLYTPDDPHRHPAVLFPSAIPEVAEELDVDLVLREEALIAVGFRARRVDGDPGAAVRIALLEDLDP